MTVLSKVQEFWERNPLWTGESRFEPGSPEFFQEHREVYLNDCLAGRFDLRFLPPPRRRGQKMRVLDLGCGVGFWTTEFAMRGLGNLYAVDLTKNALQFTGKRLAAYGLKAVLAQENAEKLTYKNETFDHVNCQGVIHHTPETSKAISEIARVLKPGGTATVSVYYRNLVLELWPLIRCLGWLLAALGGGMKGRGREKIFLEKNIDEIVRLYDGSQNPLGKSYGRKEFTKLLQPHFKIEEIYFHFFPARALPFKIPKPFHRWLDQNLPFMIYASLRKA
jgi:SAM-dependent methyltransferase